MPDVQDKLRALAGTSELSASDYAGMDPADMLRVAEHLRRAKKTRADVLGTLGQRKTAEEELNLEKLQSRIDAAVSAKELVLQEKKNKALNEFRRTKTRQLKQEINRHHLKSQFLERMRDVQVETNLGKMSTLAARSLKEAGVPVKALEPFETTVETFKNPETGETERHSVVVWPSGVVETHKLGVSPEEEGDLSKWEALEGKIDEAEQAVYKGLGASELSGLKPESRDIAIAANRLAQTRLRENPDRTGGEAGTEALQEVEGFESKLQKIKDTPYDNRAKFVNKLVPLVKKAQELEKSTGSQLFSVQRLVQEFEGISTGWFGSLDEGEAMDILKSAAMKARGE